MDEHGKGSVMDTALMDRSTVPSVVATGDGATAAELEAIQQRFAVLGLTYTMLAEKTHIDRGQISKILRGLVEKPQPATLNIIRRALDEFEEEASGPYDDDRHTVTFRMSGNFGVDVTVSGPVENLAELEGSVGRLLQRMRNGEDENG